MKKLKSLIGLSLATTLPMSAGLMGTNHINLNKKQKLKRSDSISQLTTTYYEPFSGFVVGNKATVLWNHPFPAGDPPFFTQATYSFGLNTAGINSLVKSYQDYGSTDASYVIMHWLDKNLNSFDSGRKDSFLNILEGHAKIEGKYSMFAPDPGAWNDLSGSLSEPTTVLQNWVKLAKIGAHFNPVDITIPYHINTVTADGHFYPNFQQIKGTVELSKVPKNNWIVTQSFKWQKPVLSGWALLEILMKIAAASHWTYPPNKYYNCPVTIQGGVTLVAHKAVASKLYIKSDPSWYIPLELTWIPLS